MGCISRTGEANFDRRLRQSDLPGSRTLCAIAMFNLLGVLGFHGSDVCVVTGRVGPRTLELVAATSINVLDGIRLTLDLSHLFFSFSFSFSFPACQSLFFPSAYTYIHPCTCIVEL
ncbi:hypothetical protein F5X99DRAFT_199925 [Biscogniauxia marginata]|nr:hypothetical protein F5X99DRAFT_199925 [Biscogniauxia marginata]